MAAITTMSTFLLLLFSILLTIHPSSSQRNSPPAPPNALSLVPTPAPAPAPAPASDTCNGIWITYTWNSGKKLHPRRKGPKQPFRFKSTLELLNNDDVALKSWEVFVGFQYNELLVSAGGVVLANGSTLPALVGEGTIFAGYPQANLLTAIQTAGDVSAMSIEVPLQGTQFGVAPPRVPLPNNISLVNEGYICPAPSKRGNFTLETCCMRDPDYKENMTIADDFKPRQKGDLTIMYDVTKAYSDNYWALVTMVNHNPLGRLDYWQLSWDWTADEFINSMRGAYTDIVDANDCMTGPQAKYYAGLDFSTVLNCERRPTIIDLPLQYTNDTALGYVPYCCRNGTILPAAMDASKSISAFQINVKKMPPNLNLSAVVPPQNWQIKGTLNPNYKCGPPIRVSPSEFPSPTGIRVNTTSFASWQVVCNITKPKDAKPKCCVSFSAFFNESIIPCKTCACGCPKSTGQTCSTTAPAMFLPTEGQLVPFDNRTKLSKAWAEIKHLPVPNPLPCSDNCGVSINWHVATDFNKGWSARVTLFNWDEVDFQDWFIAADLGKAGLGFEKAYSFNGTLMTDKINNNTIFMQGLPGLNYLIAETNGSKPTDPRVPGKQQSVLSFTKAGINGIDIPIRDGFPTQVFFNGEECSIPDIIPINSGYKKPHLAFITALIAVLVLIFMEQ
ncbi:COBRA-like protein 7 [Silene latifolia]|uniref:COBRA-like protein 7 n=1 Tax=Silene latifolia TaxID=37657 RepID=UPI003D78B2B0